MSWHPIVWTTMLLVGVGSCAESAAATSITPASSIASAPLATLQKWAATGNAAAEVALGQRLMLSTDPASKAKAISWYRKAAAQGDHDAEWALGEAYFNGAGVDRNMPIGLQWMRDSLAGATPSADHMAKYGVMLGLTGAFFSNRDGRVQEGAKWLRRGAEAGSTLGMLMLGDDLLTGMPGIARDPVAGEYWLLKAARLGNANAQYVLGVTYVFGGLLKPDTKAGMHWLTAASKHSWVGAEGTLGYLLVSGDKHVPKDPTEGVHWAEKAAAMHDAWGYYALGLAYQEGVGGEPSSAAKAWYNFAAAQRLDTQHQLPHITVHLSEVGGALSAKQLDELQAQVLEIPLPKKQG